VRLQSRDGAWVDLSLLRRQRTEQRGRRPEEDWAADWLVVRGEVFVPDELHRTFREPCLTPWEGRRLASWLRSAADGPPDGAAPGSTLRFTEPLLSLVLDDARAERRLLRVHVTGGPDPCVLALDVDAPALHRAAAGWSADLDASAP
jgi:hypothetical protein